MMLSHPLEPLMSQVADPLPLLALLETLGEPAAASLATVGGSPGGGMTPSPEPDPGPACANLVRTNEQIWEAVAMGIEAESLVLGTGNDVFDATLGLVGNCCWARKFKSAPGVWSGWTCGGWAISNTGSISFGCGRSITWRTTCSRTRSRQCFKKNIFCDLTITVQTQTETRSECRTDFYDTLKPGCLDTYLPNLPAVAPPPFTGTPTGCGRTPPSTFSGWTPWC